MTDLTEQYQKGELPEGWYYVKCIGDDEIVTDYYERSDWQNDWRGYCGIEKVLSEAPTYSENLALQSDSLAKNEASEIIAELEKSVKDLKHRNENLQLALKTYELPEIQKVLIDWRTGELDKKFNKLESENTKLKELLKELAEYVKKDYGDYLTYTESAISQEINQALGEE